MDVKEIIKRQNDFHAVTNGGVIPDEEDLRDYQAEKLMGSNLDVPIDWVVGYDATADVWPGMPNQNQENQFSCVGRGVVGYKQVRQAADTGEHTILSAKSVYNPIATPHVGSYVRSGMLRPVNYGINKESTVPSGGTEDEITAKFDFTPFADEASYFKDSTVASVTSQDFETLARMIKVNRGFVSGWSTHCQFFKIFGTLEGKRFLKTHGSYGLGSDMYYFEGEEDPLFSCWTAVDVKNIQNPPPKPDQFQFLKEIGSGDKNDDVTQLQIRLNIKPTGVYDYWTILGVRQLMEKSTIGSWWERNIWPRGFILNGQCRYFLNTGHL